MTRKEEILKAARDYISGVTMASPSNFIHFAAGARWAYISDLLPKGGLK